MKFETIEDTTTITFSTAITAKDTLTVSVRAPKLSDHERQQCATCAAAAVYAHMSRMGNASQIARSEWAMWQLDNVRRDIPKSLFDAEIAALNGALFALPKREDAMDDFLVRLRVVSEDILDDITSVMEHRNPELVTRSVLGAARDEIVSLRHTLAVAAAGSRNEVVR